ncbi:cation diffusion facilitator family transporter [Hydrogenovibrio sp. JE_KL2]|uniref:cation diffusion facilitator family transporter n=1 Tax=Hydrogenovibrio sp. JE_KL2 TaxID=2651188 RepID=UPI00128D0EDE|nr:cation diffusion facilitator family transporter [Hydrogenovibrio sp. JE_KL2]MPQ76483.1 cation diffusion facilitator family transporter [Hydrogenovibrio sp. JE_KL2]
MDRTLEVEKKAIKLVMIGDVLMAVLGLSFYYLTHSQAILMDGIYPFIDMTAGLLTLRVATLISKQANQNQPFGYAIYEPLLNFIKGIMILVVVIFAIYASVHALLNGGRHVVADIAVFYAVVASLLGFVLSYFLHRMNKSVKSDLIEVDLQGWLIGGVLSLAVGISFGFSMWLSSTEYKDWVPYTDPIVILVLVMLMLPLPIKVVKENGLQLIGRFENSEISDDIEELVRHELKEDRFIGFEKRYLQLGRSIYVQLYIQMKPDCDFNLQEADLFRTHLYHKLKQRYEYLAVDVIFTADPVWAKRSVGDPE